MPDTRRDNYFTGGYQTTDTEIKCHHIAQYVFAAKTVVAMRTRCRSEKTIDRKKEAREKDSRGKKSRENLLGVICAESNSFVRPTS